MQYLLFILLVTLFIISYMFCGKDFFAPSTMQIIVFIFACMMAIYFLYGSSLNYSLHYNTVFMIFTCQVLSAFIGIITHSFFKRVRVKKVYKDTQEIKPIGGIVYLISFVVIMITILWTLKEVVRIGGIERTIVETMSAFRRVNSHSADINARLPIGLRELFHLITVFIIVYGFNLIWFYKKMNLRTKIMNIGIIVLCVVSELLSGARSGVVNGFITCIMIFHLLRIKNAGKYRTYNIREILRFISICCIVLFLFMAAKGLVGRIGAMDPIKDIAGYVGTGIINLDIFKQKPTFNKDIFGKYTFFSLINNLRTLGLNIPLYTVHQKYQMLHGVSLGNVYTQYGIYYGDFGLIGVYVLQGVSALILSIFYEFTKKRTGNKEIIVFSMIYNSVVLAFFADRFYSSIVAISFIEDVLLVLLFYNLFMRKKIVVSISRQNKHI